MRRWPLAVLLFVGLIAPAEAEVSNVEACLLAAADVSPHPAGNAVHPASGRTRPAREGQPEHERHGRYRADAGQRNLAAKAGATLARDADAGISTRCATAFAPMSKAAPGYCARRSMRHTAISGMASAAITRTIPDTRPTICARCCARSCDCKAASSRRLPNERAVPPAGRQRRILLVRGRDWPAHRGIFRLDRISRANRRCGAGHPALACFG